MSLLEEAAAVLRSLVSDTHCGLRHEKAPAACDVVDCDGDCPVRQALQLRDRLLRAERAEREQKRHPFSIKGMRAARVALIDAFWPDDQKPKFYQEVPWPDVAEHVVKHHEWHHERQKELQRAVDQAKALYEGAVRTMRALADDDRLWLASVNDDYQGLVDEIVVKITELRERRRDALEVVERMSRAAAELGETYEDESTGAVGVECPSCGEPILEGLTSSQHAETCPFYWAEPA